LLQSERSRDIQNASRSIAEKNHLALDKTQKEPQKPSPTAAPRLKLSYKDQRELDGLPGRIDALEQEQQALRNELADATLYVRDPQRATALHERDGAIEEELMAALERWEALSSRA
jgi:ATP-binding cassette subfamily F protein uup